MKRLFLTSQGLGAFSSFVAKNPSLVTIAFIPTAADPYGDKWFVDKDRKMLTDQGFRLFELDIKDKTQSKLTEELNKADVVYVSGGNIFYLLDKALKSGALGIIRQLVNKGILYAGSSAGAVFAGPNIEPLRFLDDPKVAPDLNSYEALRLVDFVVLPHYGERKYLAKYEKILNDWGNREYKLIPLTDSQAIIVGGDEYQIVESR